MSLANYRISALLNSGKHNIKPLKSEGSDPEQIILDESLTMRDLERASELRHFSQGLREQRRNARSW
ncbi:MAG: hypothetical protein QXZ48_01595 [Zestosphaera sp.]